MNCSSCGKKNVTSQFCPGCGASVTPTYTHNPSSGLQDGKITVDTGGGVSTSVGKMPIHRKRRKPLLHDKNWYDKPSYWKRLLRIIELVLDFFFFWR